MFAGGKSDQVGSSNEAGQYEHELMIKKQPQKPKIKDTSTNEPHRFEGNGHDERQSFLARGKRKDNNNSTKEAKLAKQETIEEVEDTNAPDAIKAQQHHSACMIMLLRALKCKWFVIPLIIILCIAAIYCIPYVEIQPEVPKPMPHIPFNYREGPLRASTASQFKIERLFKDQISGPESIAHDSMGNMYMASEGGFILYAHLNKSSLPKRTYYINDPPNSLRAQQPFDILSPDYTELVKIAELNGIKQLPYDNKRRSTRDSATRIETRGSWRRECQLDEQIYGQTLYSGGPVSMSTAASATNEIEGYLVDDDRRAKKFVSNVRISRCSKPLGIRLSPDESHLYVIDTLSGLYRVNLKNTERQFSTQRQVTKLIDFRANRHQLLPVTHLDDNPQQQQQQSTLPELSPIARPRELLNITLMAIDDLVVDYGAGSKGGDMIYLSDASQKWLAVSALFDILEGKPSGAILRYDTGINQLSVLAPTRVAHVRTSVLEFVDDTIKSRSENISSELFDQNRQDLYLGIGAPRFDENDIFDDRPLHFPNGLELTDDRQAILIADTGNKRILKHYIKGHRRGTSDLWAWTPHFPDNIRRGYDKHIETYWVVGCGHDATNKFDLTDWLRSWPRLRKYMLKNIYLFGWLFEMIGDYVLRSNSVRDFGYSLKVGHSILENFCSGMMILQYNKYGDVIRSIYGKEFPSDIFYYSQVNEVIDAKNQEHALYLGSPSYSYVTKLILPSDLFDVSPYN